MNIRKGNIRPFNHFSISHPRCYLRPNQLNLYLSSLPITSLATSVTRTDRNRYCQILHSSSSKIQDHENLENYPEEDPLHPTPPCLSPPCPCPRCPSVQVGNKNPLWLPNNTSSPSLSKPCLSSPCLPPPCSSQPKLETRTLQGIYHHHQPLNPSLNSCLLSPCPSVQVGNKNPLKVHVTTSLSPRFSQCCLSTLSLSPSWKQEPSQGICHHQPLSTLLATLSLHPVPPPNLEARTLSMYISPPPFPQTQSLHPVL